MPIYFPSNPKGPDSGWLIADEASLQSLAKHIAIALEQGESLDATGDTGLGGIRKVALSEIKKMQQRDGRPTVLKQSMGMLTCATLVALGVSLGAFLGTVVLGLLVKSDA